VGYVVNIAIKMFIKKEENSAILYLTIKVKIGLYMGSSLFKSFETIPEK